MPQGEVWVVERGGSFSRALEAGRHVLIPFIDKIKTVKLGSLISTGVIAPGVVSKSTLTNQDGAQVDAYCVVYFKVADFAKSAYFVDVESNKLDSERAAARTARKAMAAHIATLSVTDGQISTADQKSLEDKVMQALIAKQAKYGLEFSHVEVRGAFDVQAGVSDKIRALEAPHPDFEGPGHDLPNDYWQQHLTPAFFEKCTFGSYKVPKTPAAVSLEWSVPSPPDFHHFNEIPKLTVPPAETAEGKVIANAH